MATAIGQRMERLPLPVTARKIRNVRVAEQPYGFPAPEWGATSTGPWIWSVSTPFQVEGTYAARPVSRRKCFTDRLMSA